MAQTYYTPFVVDHTKVPNTDQTNFPVGILLTSLARLKVTGSGGHVAGSSGFDIRPYSDAALTTALTYELVYYLSTSGALEMYVLVPTLSHTADYTIYLGYGDASLNTDGSSTSTWNSNFKAVYHFGDGTTLGLNDSTANANTLTNIASSTAGAGAITGGAVVLDGATQYLRRTANAAATALPMTYSALYNPTNVSANRNVLSQAVTATNNTACQLIQRVSNVQRCQAQNATVAAEISSVTSGAWNYGAGRFISTTSRFAILNANTPVQNTNSDSALTTPDNIAVGALYRNSTAVAFFLGSIDECRISDLDRGADWAVTEYNNLLFPSTFAVTGTEVAVSGATSWGADLSDTLNHIVPP